VSKFYTFKVTIQEIYTLFSAGAGALAEGEALNKFPLCYHEAHEGHEDILLFLYYFFIFFVPFVVFSLSFCYGGK